MISAEQIKGARAMLDWSQDTLAQEAGVSAATIYNLERGQLSFGSARKIRVALERKGFEFIGTNGLTRSEEKPVIFDGTDACDRFYEHMLATAQKWDSELVAVYRTPELFVQSLGAQAPNLERLSRLREHAKIRCLLSSAQNAKLAVPQCQFRAIPHHPFDPLALLICGDQYAIITSKGRDFSFFVMRSIETAEAGRAEFEKHWALAFPLAA